MSKIKDSRRIIAIEAAGCPQWFSVKDFKGQDYIPHKARNNRKTKKGGKK